MPVKWDPAMDQILLLKILETHELKVDAKKVSSAWPSDRGETPTPRAITERLVKIRQSSKAAGSGHFGISSAQTKATSDAPSASTPSTPSRPRTITNTPKTLNTVTNAGSPTKRKRDSTLGSTDIKVEDTEVIDLSAQKTASRPNAFTSKLNGTPSLPSNTTHSGVSKRPSSSTLQTPTKGMRDLSVESPAGPVENETEDGGSPSKRPRRSGADNRTPYEDDDDDGAESDASEYVV